MAERQWFQSNAQALNPLVQQTVYAAVAREIGARELANVAYGAAVAFAMVGQPDAPLFTALPWAAGWRVGNFSAHDLASTAWALTESAARVLESCRSEALGGGYEGDGSRVDLKQSDAHPTGPLGSGVLDQNRM